MAAPQANAIRTLALLRHSTNAQDNARQKADIERLKRKFGIEVVDTLVLEGVSGRKVMENSKFRTLLNDLCTRADIDGLALSAIDRFFRTDSYRDTGLFQPLADGRKMIFSVREGEVDPSTDEGFTTCLTAALKSGAEWRELRRRSMDGKEEIAKAGFLPHSIPWYGVDIIGRRQTGVIGEARAVINETEAAIVREVFAMYRSGMSAYTIAMELNQRGVRSKGSNGKPPALWSRQTIQQMLSRQEYIGKHCWRGIVIPVPRIIEDELFYAVNAMKQETKRRWVGRPSLLYLLRTFVFCARCKHRLGGNRKRPGQCRTYGCTYQTEHPPKRRLCPAARVSADALERVVWEQVWDVLTDPKRLLRMGRELFAPTPTGKQVVADLEKQLARLKQLERNASAQIDEAENDEDLAHYRKQRTQIRSKIAVCESQLREAGKIVKFPSESELEKQIRKIVNPKYQPTDYAGRRAILEALMDFRAEYDDATGEVTITGKVAVAAPAAPETGETNCKPRIDTTCNSAPPVFEPIPFYRKVRVAA